jgi:putative chitinase
MTPKTLAACVGSSLELATLYEPGLTEGMAIYAIDATPYRTAAFLANVAHESCRLHYTTELWGPTPAQKGYEGRADLGNTKPGDGSLFRGHGLIQTTGRANHATVRDRLRMRFPDTPDFEAFPAKLASTRWAALSACDFWGMHNLNALADAGDFDGVCDVINRGHKTKAEGDSNGFADRHAAWVIAKAVLGVA